MINVAMIGFGGIAKAAHFPAYMSLAEKGKANLVAVCDICPEKMEGSAEINIGSADIKLDSSVKKYSCWHEMLKNEKIDMVDICLPTYLHTPVTVEALNMGYNVLCEKPMSLSYENCREMIEAANKNGKELMIGQCIRFGAKYNYLKKVVDENTFGKVKSGTFRRMSAPPVWSWENWYMDYEKSHGCVNDMHIHDLDFVRCCFGEPEAVSCFTHDVYSQKDIAHSTLKYNDFSMLVIGDWSQEGMPFTAEYCVAFENATVNYADDIITVYPRGGEPFKPEVENDNFYYNEIEYFVKTIEDDLKNTVNPPEESAKTIRLVSALIESSDNGGAFVTVKDI